VHSSQTIDINLHITG